MHLQLTDILCCPRCGPGSVLVLLVEEISERRVRRGSLGCASCREQYGIAEGVADLRGAPIPSPSEPGPERVAAPLDTPADAHADGAGAAHSGADPDGVTGAEALRIAALAGVSSGPAYLLLLGPAAIHAEAVADMLPDVHVIAATDAQVTVRAHPAVSRVLVTQALPFQDGRISGVVLSGALSQLVPEGARVLARDGRLVLQGAPPETATLLEAASLHVAASADDVLIALRR